MARGEEVAFPGSRSISRGDRKVKMGRILGIVVALGLVAAMVVGAASSGAWFGDDIESQGNSFTAGDLYLQIGDSDGPVAATWTSPSNWAPGEVFEADIIIENKGSIDVLYLCGDIHSYDHTDPGSDGSSLADVIEVVKLQEYIPGYGWTDSLADPQHFHELVVDYLWPLTLDELMKSYHSGEPYDNPGDGLVEDEFGKYVTNVTDWCAGGGYDITPGPAIIAGGEYRMRLAFKFSEDADNDYQNDTCQFDITFYAMQDLSQRQ